MAAHHISRGCSTTNSQFGLGSITMPEFKQAKFLGVRMYVKMKIGAKSALILLLVWFGFLGMVWYSKVVFLFMIVLSQPQLNSNLNTTKSQP